MAAVMACVAVVAAACGGPSSPTASPSSPFPSRPQATSSTPNAQHWIVADWAIAMLQKAGTPISVIRHIFDNTDTYLIVHRGEGYIDSELPSAVKTDRFTSFSTMQQAFASSSIPPGVKAIMYDNERWNFTPSIEQQHPIQYAAEAEALVHKHGMTFIFAPATNLSPIAGSASAAGSKYQAFITDDLPAQSARVADVYEIQAQQAEGTPEFTSFVSQAVAQARAANPRALVLVGIGPNPGGRSVSASQVLADYEATRSEVNGYWLNVPTKGAQCPNCGAPDPEAAVFFLDAIASAPTAR